MIPTLFIVFLVFLVTCLTAAAVNLSNEDSQTIIVPDQNESAFSPHVNRTILSHLVFGMNDLGEKAYDSLPEMLESMKAFEDLPRVLMVGITGAGKSLAIAKLLGFPLKWICGKTTGCGYNIDYARLNELKEKETTNYPLSAPPEIGTSGFSKTLYSTFHQDNDFVWVDTPGFLGNRGSEVDVMEDISRELVIRGSKKIQAIGIVVEFASIDRGGDLNFVQLLNRVTEWLPDSKIRDNLLFFVLTKVPQEMHDEENLNNFIEQKIQVYKKNADELHKRMIPYLKNNDSQSLKAIEELQNQFTLFRDGVELLRLMSKPGRKLVLNPRESDIEKLRREVESCIFRQWPNRRTNDVDGSKQAGIFRFIYANASKKAEYPKYLQDIATTGRKVMSDLSTTKNLAESLNQTLHILESTERLSAIDKKKSMQIEIERLGKQISHLQGNIALHKDKIQSLKNDLTPVALDPIERQFQSYYSILPNSFDEFAHLLGLSGQVITLAAVLYSGGGLQSFWNGIALITGIQESSLKLKEAFDKSRTVTITAVDTGPFPLNDQKPYHWEVYEVIGGQNLPATNVTTSYEFDKSIKKFTLHCLPPFRTYFYQKSYVASVKLYIDKRNAKSTQDEITGLQNQIDQFKEEITQYQDQINDFKTILTLKDPVQKINQDIQEIKETLKSVKRSYRKLKSKWERLQHLFQVLFQSEALLDLLTEDLHVIKLFKQEYEDYVNSIKPPQSASELHSEL